MKKDTESEQKAGKPEQPDLKDVFARYSGLPSDLIPVLQDVQDRIGYLPPEAMRAISAFLRIPESTVYGVATFYSQFYLTRQGRHKVRICQGTACHVRGAARVRDTVQKKLGIKPGQTTEDYSFSLETVACFGSCALAPVMVVDGKVHGRMTPQKAERILESMK